MSESHTPAAHARKCPICSRRADEKLSPFCSKRCADVDLGRWFTESYAVPGRRDPEADDETG
jgi:endogenous inhibitor of DNA gyrase (YacG/DUF329 family)